MKSRKKKKAPAKKRTKPAERSPRIQIGLRKNRPAQAVEHGALFVCEGGIFAWDAYTNRWQSIDVYVAAEVAGWVCVRTPERDAWWMTKGEYAARFG